MSCLTNMCYVCLEKNKIINNINSSPSVNKDIIDIIGYHPFNLAWLKSIEIILICEECCLRLRETYQFLEMCHKNSALLQGYMDELNTTTISNTASETEHKDEVNYEIKLEDEDIYTDEYGSIMEETDNVFVDFVKEENSWKMEEVKVENNSIESRNNNTDGVQTTTTNTNDDLNTKLIQLYKCSTCCKCFNKYTELRNHKRVHTDEKTYKCPRCDRIFNRHSNLVRHVRIHTGEKPYVCPKCKKCYTRQTQLSYHIRTHTGEKPFECTRCEKLFNDRTQLIKHMRTHTGEKPYICATCKKGFAQQTSLVYHMRVHTGEKPHECSTCKKCYSRHSDLVVHMRKHTGERPFKCSTCGKCFVDKSGLNRHLRRHTREKR